MNQIIKNLPEILPVLPVRDSVIFPRMVISLLVRSDDERLLVDDALKKDKLIVVALVKGNPDPVDDEGPTDTHAMGTAALIMKMSQSDEGSVVVVQGLTRVALTEILEEKSYRRARVRKVTEKDYRSKKATAMMTQILALFNRIVDLSNNLPHELIQISRNIDEPGILADMIASSLNLDRNKKQEILDSLEVKERLEKLTAFLKEELSLQEMGLRIQDKVREGLDKSEREYFLREQLKTIQRELGLDKEEPTEIEELTELLRNKPLPDEVRKTGEKEIERLAKMHPSSAEYTVARTYIDWILDLPWLKATTDNLDIKRAEAILDRYHYDLEKVKKRILEYLAVQKLNPGHKGPILCLVGPPGTGKTSLGKAIAEALGRRFIRMSLGGVKDEAEIRGHRRTYVGALPGRIVQGIKRVDSNNPLFMLDEIDKVGSDFRGDLSSALLEVLDPEQNFSFSDHYLELDFDLSKVMFITTANTLDTVPPPLRDRMEVLELTGYTEGDKMHIATRFLVPRQIEENGLKRKKVSFKAVALRRIIREYTREAGLRNLEREIGAVCRGLARKVAEGEEGPFVIGEEEVAAHLGRPRFLLDLAQRTAVPGVATGLAWTPAGGEILFVEATMMPGQKSLVLTGQLGDVMKESAQAALSYLRSRGSTLGIAADFFQDHDLHIHVPAGAIPKDGPSAGVTLLTALASLFTARPVRPRLAMTGEVTLRGLVLPVGGIKDKVLAASRSGIREVILPEGNRNDLEDIPERIRKQLKFHLVRRVEEVLEIALKPASKTAGATGLALKGKKKAARKRVRPAEEKPAAPAVVHGGRS